MLIWEPAFCLGYNGFVVHCLAAITTGHMGRDTRRTLFFIILFSLLRPVCAPQALVLFLAKIRFWVRQKKTRKLRFLGNLILRNFRPSWWLSSNWACPNYWESFGLRSIRPKKSTFQVFLILLVWIFLKLRETSKTNLSHLPQPPSNLKSSFTIRRKSTTTSC